MLATRRLQAVTSCNFILLRIKFTASKRPAKLVSSQWSDQTFIVFHIKATEYLIVYFHSFAVEERVEEAKRFVIKPACASKYHHRSQVDFISFSQPSKLSRTTSRPKGRLQAPRCPRKEMTMRRLPPRVWWRTTPSHL